MKFLQVILSVLFTIIFFSYSLLLCIIFSPTLLMPKKYARFVPWLWATINPYLLRLCSIKIQIKGIHNLPKKNGYIIASNHQSALETTLFHALVPNTVYVLKKQLLWLPVTGWYFLKTGCIPIDRKGGSKTMRMMFHATQKRLAEGCNVVIFPEGTRIPPDQSVPYSPGIALMYEQCQVPVVPVALNSGYCWQKNKTIKKPGTVTLEFLKPIEPGLPRREFLKQLQDVIEEARKKLPDPFGKQP